VRIIEKVKRTKEKSIVLFGGSFDPPHLGHEAIVKILARDQAIDRILIMPVYRHPWDKQGLSYRHRIAMCRLAFKPISPKVQISELEESLGGVSYSIKTVKSLKRRWCRSRIFFVLGRDSYKQRYAWKDITQLEALVDFIVFERGPDSKIPDVSSTMVREGLRSGQTKKLLSKTVRSYIEDKQLY
jgi:nicotinate-nucleotide adenylyltransferase